MAQSRTCPVFEVFPAEDAHSRRSPPEVPVVIVAISDVLLFQPHDGRAPIRWDNEATHSHQSNYFPVVGIHKPLTIATEPQSGHVRMRYSAIIAPLGVLVVGSDQGRVGVFSLTKVTVEADAFDRCQYTLQTREFVEKTAGNGAGSKTVYSFRFDHMLPETAREGIERFPALAICGIAVGPVPRSGYDRGAGSEPDSRRGEEAGCFGDGISPGPVVYDPFEPSLDDGGESEASDEEDSSEAMPSDCDHCDDCYDREADGFVEHDSFDEDGVLETNPAVSHRRRSRSGGDDGIPDGSPVRPWRIVVTRADQRYSIFHIWRDDDGVVRSLFQW